MQQPSAAPGFGGVGACHRSPAVAEPERRCWGRVGVRAVPCTPLPGHPPLLLGAVQPCALPSAWAARGFSWGILPKFSCSPWPGIPPGPWCLSPRLPGGLCHEPRCVSVEEGRPVQRWPLQVVLVLWPSLAIQRAPFVMAGIAGLPRGAEGIPFPGDGPGRQHALQPGSAAEQRATFPLA